MQGRGHYVRRRLRADGDVRLGLVPQEEEEEVKDPSVSKRHLLYRTCQSDVN